MFGTFFQNFGMSTVCHRVVRDMIEEFLLNPPFGEKGRFLWCVSVCAILWVLWDERNSMVFRGVEKGCEGLWSLVRFYVSC